MTEDGNSPHQRHQRLSVLWRSPSGTTEIRNAEECRARKPERGLATPSEAAETHSAPFPQSAPQYCSASSHLFEVAEDRNRV